MDLATTNQRVFEVYLGLTASGYDLGNPNRTRAINEIIRTANWDRQTLQYFKYACINDGRVNPYWPIASILTLASLLLDLDPSNFGNAILRTHLAALDNVSPEDINDDLINWAGDLIEQIELIRETQGYAEAWAGYQQIVQGEIEHKGNQYQIKIQSAQDRLFDLLPSKSTPTEVTTILNPLQADPLTDVVSVYNCHYVITSHLRAGSFIHELIHILLNPFLSQRKEQISANIMLLDPVYDRMEPLSYAWDHSDASWQNVFSETLVRALTILVSGDENQESQEAQIEDLVQQGFIYSRPIAETIRSVKRIQALSSDWLEECLKACAAIVA